MRCLLNVTTVGGFFCALLVAPSFAVDNGLGLTPQMGYNSWYDLMCSPLMNETVLRSRADFFVTNGFKDLGYEYINLDDCFIAPGASGRDANGNLVEDPATFPSGMRSLSDYIHNVGLKFGVCKFLLVTICDRGDTFYQAFVYLSSFLPLPLSLLAVVLIFFVKLLV